VMAREQLDAQAVHFPLAAYYDSRVPRIAGVLG
jgi:hypothetical protein